MQHAAVTTRRMLEHRGLLGSAASRRAVGIANWVLVPATLLGFAAGPWVAAGMAAATETAATGHDEGTRRSPLAPGGPHDRLVRDQGPLGDLTVSVADAETRRIELTLRRPWFALYAGVRPTLVIGGRGQPAQWGLGTWQVSSQHPVVIGVFLFNRVWRFGQAEFALSPDDAPALVYRAPALPFSRGRIGIDARSGLGR